MLSIIKTLKLIILKIFNKFINCLSFYIILSIICHLILVLFLNLNNSIDIIKNNNNNNIHNISYIKTNMIDFNPHSMTINDNNNKKIYTTPIIKKNKKCSTENYTNNILQMNKNKNVNNKNIKKLSLNNITKTTHSSQETIKVNDVISKLAKNQCINKNLKITKKNDNNLLTNNIENIHINEIENFKNKIHQAISDKFYNYSSYIGQSCDINIQIGWNGELISLFVIKGDVDLCKAAKSATKLAKLPKPPNNDIYDIFKNTTLKFSPK